MSRASEAFLRNALAKNLYSYYFDGLVGLSEVVLINW